MNSELSFYVIYCVCSVFCLYSLIHDHLLLYNKMTLLEFLEVAILSCMPVVGIVITLLVVGKMVNSLRIKILNKFRNITVLHSEGES